MLNYVMNVCYYLVMKAEGKSIAQHPVVQHLVEMRVYMEKMNPLENKLKYQIDKLLRTASKGEAAGEDDAMQLEVRVFWVWKGGEGWGEGGKGSGCTASSNMLMVVLSCLCFLVVLFSWWHEFVLFCWCLYF